MKEIERKFLVTSEVFKALSDKVCVISQGYLNNDPHRTVRVRMIDTKGFITIKGITTGIVRDEYEYEIPLKDAKELLKLCPKILVKIRHYVTVEDHLWEVDEFLDREEPLTVAEIELESEEERFTIPYWVGKEVSNDPKYYNSNL